MEMFEMVKEFIKPELLILIPVLYILGVGFKKTSLIKDKYIPIALGVISIVLSSLYLFATSDVSGAKEIVMFIFTAITQGVLLAAGSVYANQIYKQLNKKGA